jgi:hypothetical protein
MIGIELGVIALVSIHIAYAVYCVLAAARELALYLRALPKPQPKNK